MIPSRHSLQGKLSSARRAIEQEDVREGNRERMFMPFRRLQRAVANYQDERAGVIWEQLNHQLISTRIGNAHGIMRGPICRAMEHIKRSVMHMNTHIQL